MYDKEFRVHLSHFPQRSWAIILQQAWSMYLNEKLPSRDKTPLAKARKKFVKGITWECVRMDICVSMTSAARIAVNQGTVRIFAENVTTQTQTVVGIPHWHNLQLWLIQARIVAITIPTITTITKQTNELLCSCSFALVLYCR